MSIDLRGIGAIILAAGASKRMGFPKQLIEICGEPMIRVVVSKIHGLGFGEVVLVLGHSAREILDALGSYLERLRIVFNDRYMEGIATSLIAGVKALEGRVEAFIVILSDQPFVRPSTILNIAKAYREARDRGADPVMVIPTYSGARGNPVLISSEIIPEILELSGDVGARILIERHKDNVLYVDTSDPGVVIDIDTIEDLDRARREGTRARGYRC